MATLINQHIPDHVQITDVETKADLRQEMTIEFGRNYRIEPSYEIYAPLAFAEDAVIAYADDFDGWNDDLDDLELTEGTYVRLTADAQNLVPATLIGCQSNISSFRQFQIIQIIIPTVEIISIFDDCILGKCQRCINRCV